jgi:Arc/MetJ-type ribon-helix-helix transcriptional regulator
LTIINDILDRSEIETGKLRIESQFFKIMRLFRRLDVAGQGGMLQELGGVLMAYQLSSDLERLVRERMAAGGYSTEDEVLRDALSALEQFGHSAEDAREEYRQAAAAVREGTADMEAGRMRPLREVLAEARSS